MEEKTSTGIRKAARRSGPSIRSSDSAIPADALGEFLAEQEDGPDPVARPRPESGESERRASANYATEPVVDRLMTGPHKSQFLLLADWFEGAINERGSEVSVLTDVGNVKFHAIEWTENPGFVKVIVDIKKMPFEQQALAKLKISYRGKFYEMTCVSPLSPMFGGLPFADILLAVDKPPTTQTTMEKNARLEIGKTPSSVSGKPSTGVDHDEPVADGEKSASVRGVLPDQNFDVSRDEEDG